MRFGGHFETNETNETNEESGKGEVKNQILMNPEEFEKYKKEQAGEEGAEEDSDDNSEDNTDEASEKIVDEDIDESGDEDTDEEVEDESNIDEADKGMERQHSSSLNEKEKTDDEEKKSPMDVLKDRISGIKDMFTKKETVEPENKEKEEELKEKKPDNSFDERIRVPDLDLKTQAENAKQFTSEHNTDEKEKTSNERQFEDCER